MELQPSPEQQAIIAARCADPGGSLRVLAFAGSGKTTALRLLAEADTTPALYIAYNKSTQREAQGRFPAHVACRTMHSLAFRARRMFDQQHRLERKLTGRELAERLAIPVLDGLRPSFWGHCVIATVRRFTHSTAREIDCGHLPPLPPGTDRAELVITLARKLWASLDELHAVDRDGLPHLTPEERDQELHLLYVAATRARQQLEPNAAVWSCHAGRAAVRLGCAAA